MSFKFLNRITKTFQFRLTVLFSVACILVCLLVFVFAYFLLSSSLQANDRIAIELKLKDFSNEYRLGSLAKFKRKIELESESGNLKTFMVRLADPQNKTITLHRPAEDPKYDYSQLEKTRPESGQWTQLKATGEDDILDITSLSLPDSNFIQVGKGPEEREDLLDQFLSNFLEVVLVAVLLSVAAGAILSRRALLPLRRLTAALGPIIDTGKVKARIPVPRSGDEFQELCLRFNQAFQKIDTLVEGMQGSMDNVAHDLRTPMTRLRAVAESALQTENSGHVYREALSDCLEESEHVLRMLNTLMDISEVETGSVKLNIAPVNLSEIVTEVTELYRFVAEDRRIALRSDLPPSLIVEGDRQRLLQMLANLVDNAIKYTAPEGDVEIEAKSDGSFANLTIYDSGIGIPPEDLRKIWDRSFRGDRSRSQRGLGLGLSLVRAVVVAHKGSIDVTSIQGKGTQFSLRLPTTQQPLKQLENPVLS